MFAPRRKAAGGIVPTQPGGGWHPVIREPFSGAWQRGMELRTESLATHHTVYACWSLISSDIAKMRLVMRQRDSAGVWQVVQAFPPFFRKPNRYQNRIEFFRNWVTSKLLHGNTYALKERDEEGRVARLYILDPTRTRPMVAPDGSIWYSLGADNLSGVTDGIVVPAAEIIHDKGDTPWHPLCGISPIAACALSVTQGLSIQQHAEKFFRSGAQPGGILTAPGKISEENYQRLKNHWEQEYSGPNNAGKVAILGDGLKYEAMGMSAVDAQLIEQLKWTAQMVADCFHVPAYKVGAGPVPTNNNVEALDQQYYSQCLQIHIEQIELCLHEGFGLPPDFDVHLVTEDLLRMDTATKNKVITEGVTGGILTPNEGRLMLNRGPVEGGDTPYLQQQNYSLAALNKRDQKEDPFAKGERAPTAEETARAVVEMQQRILPPPAPPDSDDDATADDLAAEVDRLLEAA